MAQNIDLLGAQYPSVPSVLLPKVGGGTASFVDVTDTTATAADVASGKVFYSAAGVRSTGTASGGGGGDDPYPVRNDGKTHLWIKVDDLVWPSVNLYFKQSTANGIMIDWGDGTVESAGSSLTVRPSHTYNATGLYEVVLYQASSSAYVNFNTFSSTTNGLMGSTANEKMNNLGKLMAAELNNFRMTASNAKLVAAPIFRNCINLEKVTLVGTFTSFRLTSSTNLYSLRSITMPDEVTTFLIYGTGVMLPNLKDCKISSAITAIAASTFSECWSLSSIVIPAAVTTIGANAFANCYSMANITFLPTTPPTVANATAWTNLPTTCVIHVPSGKLANYTAAANYPDPTAYTYVED